VGRWAGCSRWRVAGARRRGGDGRARAPGDRTGLGRPLPLFPPSTHRRYTSCSSGVPPPTACTAKTPEEETTELTSTCSEGEGGEEGVGAGWKAGGSSGSCRPQQQGRVPHNCSRHTRLHIADGGARRQQHRLPRVFDILQIEPQARHVWGGGGRRCAAVGSSGRERLHWRQRQRQPQRPPGRPAPRKHPLPGPITTHPPAPRSCQRPAGAADPCGGRGRRPQRQTPPPRPCCPSLGAAPRHRLTCGR
jgi:hypothetical protein